MNNRNGQIVRKFTALKEVGASFLVNYCSGCGLFDRVVTSEAKGPRFQSGQQQILFELQRVLNTE